MATITDLIPSVLDYLVTQCTASPVLGAATPIPVVVTDGPPVTGDTAAQRSHLWIGWDAISDAGLFAGEAGSDTQVFSFLDSGQTRDETATVTCSAEFWTGATVMKTARDGCKGIVAAVEKLLRGSPGIGQSPGDASMGGLVQWSQVTGTRWRQAQNESGAAVTCAFTIGFFARLTS